MEASSIRIPWPPLFHPFMSHHYPASSYFKSSPDDGANDLPDAAPLPETTVLPPPPPARNRIETVLPPPPARNRIETGLPPFPARNRIQFKFVLALVIPILTSLCVDVVLQQPQKIHRFGRVPKSRLRIRSPPTSMCPPLLPQQTCLRLLTLWRPA